MPVVTGVPNIFVYSNNTMNGKLTWVRIFYSKFKTYTRPFNLSHTYPNVLIIFMYKGNKIHVIIRTETYRHSNIL